MLTRIRYRTRQFGQTFFAQPLTVEEWAQVSQILTEPEKELFQKFPTSDQRHSYHVLTLLLADGHCEQSLLKAALLHDIGKTKVHFTMLDRVLVVLGFKLLPDQAARLSQGEAQGWSRPFVVKAKHPQWGAEMATAVGSDALTVSLIRWHQDDVSVAETDEEARLLRILQWADDQA